MRKIIAIGGPHGSGKSSVAKKLAEEFGMKYISAGEVFRQMAKERNISLKEMSKLVIDEPEVDIQIDDRTKELGQYENTLVDAQLSAFFIPDDALVRISITASKQVRWERIAKRDGCTLEQARQETDTREMAEKRRFSDLYDINVDNQDVYDVIINSDRLTEEQVHSLAKAIVISRLELLDTQ